MKTTKGGKVMNPTDAYRKELRKKELKRNKKERKKVREVGILKKDPETIKDQIEKLEMMKADGALDKARKHKKRQLEDTLNLVLKKRKEYEEKMREKGETPVMFSHLGPLRRRTAAEEEERANHPKPEDSVYYHPTLNPTGAPPPGKPQMYKSTIGPRIPLGASASTAASSSNPEHEEEGLGVPPLPPPPPLPSNEVDPVDDSDVPKSLPLPPPPPAPPMPAKESITSLPRAPLPPPPPPPPGLPPNGSTGIQSSLSPPPPPGTTQAANLNNKSATSESQNPMEFDQATAILRPVLPPPPGLPPKQSDQSQASASESSTVNKTNAVPRMVHLPPPPPRHLPPLPPRFPLVPTQPSDMLPPGVSRVPPSPSDMIPPPVPGLPSRPPPPPPGMHVLPSSMPAYGVPQMPHGILRPPLPPGPPPFQEDAGGPRFYAPQKPSYVKSAAPTVVKRPLAQHTPELTAMVPASVRVRRESTAQKAKPKSQIPMVTTILKPSIPAAPIKSFSQPASISAPKTQSIDDSYMAFLEDMKELGALDG